MGKSSTPATLPPPYRACPGSRHGGHEGHEGDEGHEGEEGEQRDEEGGDEGPGHEEGHEEEGDRGGMREKQWGRLQKAFAGQIVACRCGLVRRAWPRVFARPGVACPHGPSVSSLARFGCVRLFIEGHSECQQRWS